MSKNTWDAVLASSPLNATAGRVAAKGYDYQPDIRHRNIHEWDGPPELAPVGETHRRNPSFVDLTGHVFGRLTVLGMMKPCANSKTALWVCRCTCGKYVGRRAKSIKNRWRDRCDTCDHNAYLAEAASGNNARVRAESAQARKW